jgi:signal transduction histidine kinase
LGNAIFSGVASFFKIVVILIAALIAFALYWVVLYVAFLVCRIPGLGPLIYAIALPAAVILTTFVLVGYVVASCIVLPAVWEGHTLRAAIARLYAVASHRPMEVFAQLLILWLVLSLISIVVIGFLVSSSFLVGGISLAALGERAGSLLGGFGGGSILQGLVGSLSGLAARGGEGGGYAIAGVFGIAIVWVLAVAAYTSVFLMGINLVYLSASEGIDSSAAEAKLSRGLAQAKQKASEMQEHAKQRALELQERARQAEEQRRMAAQAAAAGVGAAGTESIEAAARCPGCGASITGSDAFCGECGHRLG